VPQPEQFDAALIIPHGFVAGINDSAEANILRGMANERQTEQRQGASDPTRGLRPYVVARE